MIKYNASLMSLWDCLVSEHVFQSSSFVIKLFDAAGIDFKEIVDTGVCLTDLYISFNPYSM